MGLNFLFFQKKQLAELNFSFFPKKHPKENYQVSICILHLKTAKFVLEKDFSEFLHKLLPLQDSK